MIDWRGLSGWLYENGVPDFDKLAARTIGCVYVDARSANAAEVIADIHGRGLGAGVYVVADWYRGIAPLAFARTVSGFANKLIPRQDNAEAPPLMLDLEAVDKTWIAAAVQAYRRYQPSRPTSFTTEPYQDGSVLPMPILKAASLHWYVQLYRGDMTPVDPAAAILEACRCLPPDRVHPFYDAKLLPADARDGCVFTLERLP